MTVPTIPAVAQIVRSSSVAPSAFITRALIVLLWISPCVPMYEYGRIDSPPCSSCARRRPAATSSSASSQSARRNSPAPLAPVRTSGCSRRSSE